MNRETRILPDDWFDYGPDDPLDAHRWLNACAACNATPSLTLLNLLKSPRWRVLCACGAISDICRTPWSAAFAWNKSRKSVHPSWRSLPFFGLGDLDEAQANAKLSAICAHLSAQRDTARDRLRLARLGQCNPPGRKFEQRLQAYQHWALYALALLNEDAERARGRADA